MKIGRYTDDEILKYMTEDVEGSFLGRSMFDSIRETILYKDQQIERLNSIIKELDDYIDEHTEFEHDGDEYGYMEWYDTKDVDLTTFITDIKEILRKGDKE